MIVQVVPVIDHNVRELCRRRYLGHPRGCPNHGRRKTCPPAAPFFEDEFDATKPVYAIITEFDLGAHVDKMRWRHPGWSERQLRCCLYWQGTARVALRYELATFVRFKMENHLHGYKATTCPEAMGVDVTATLKAAGVVLEWPPVKIARQVALAGVRRLPEIACY